MSLESSYAQVKRSSIFGGMIPTGGFVPEIQKDPTIARLEQDVFSKLRELSPEEVLQDQKSNTNSVKVLSPEEAMKELIEMEKAFSQPK